MSFFPFLGLLTPWLSSGSPFPFLYFYNWFASLSPAIFSFLPALGILILHFLSLNSFSFRAFLLPLPSLSLPLVFFSFSSHLFHCLPCLASLVLHLLPLHSFSFYTFLLTFLLLSLVCRLPLCQPNLALLFQHDFLNFVSQCGFLFSLSLLPSLLCCSLTSRVAHCPYDLALDNLGSVPINTVASSNHSPGCPIPLIPVTRILISMARLGGCYVLLLHVQCQPASPTDSLVIAM